MDIFKRVYARNTTIEAGKPATESPLDDDFQRTQDEFPLKYRRTLLAGPQFSGRTSVLFEIAFQYAAIGHFVLFISPRKFTKLPMMLNRCDPPSVEVLKRIEIVYLETKNDYLGFMASVHTKQKDPVGLVVVDGIDCYYKSTGKQNELAELAKVFAFLLDAAEFLGKSRTRANGDSLPCSMVCSVTTTTEGNPQIPNKSLMKMWFKDFMLLQKNHKSNVFSVFIQETEKYCEKQGSTFEYMITDQKIELC